MKKEELLKVIESFRADPLEGTRMFFKYLSMNTALGVLESVSVMDPNVELMMIIFRQIMTLVLSMLVTGMRENSMASLEVAFCYHGRSEQPKDGIPLKLVEATNEEWEHLPEEIKEEFRRKFPQISTPSGLFKKQQKSSEMDDLGEWVERSMGNQ